MKTNFVHYRDVILIMEDKLKDINLSFFSLIFFLSHTQNFRIIRIFLELLFKFYIII